MCVWGCVSLRMCGESILSFYRVSPGFFPSITWVLDMKLRLSELVASAFTHGTLLPSDLPLSKSYHTDTVSIFPLMYSHQELT